MLDIDIRDRNEQRSFGMVMAAALTVLGLVRWWHRGALPGWMVFAGLGYFVVLMVAARLVRREDAILWTRYVIAGAGIVGVYLLRDSFGATGFPWILLALAIAFLALGAGFPKVLQPIFWAWIRLAIALNWLVTRLVLTVVFFVMFVPVRVVFSLTGHDPLNRKWLPPGESYWEEPDAQPKDLEAYFNQF